MALHKILQFYIIRNFIKERFCTFLQFYDLYSWISMRQRKITIKTNLSWTLPVLIFIISYHYPNASTCCRAMRWPWNCFQDTFCRDSLSTRWDSSKTKKQKVKLRVWIGRVKNLPESRWGQQRWLAIQSRAKWVRSESSDAESMSPGCAAAEYCTVVSGLGLRDPSIPWWLAWCSSEFLSFCRNRAADQCAAWSNTPRLVGREIQFRTRSRNLWRGEWLRLPRATSGVSHWQPFFDPPADSSQSSRASLARDVLRFCS